MTIELEIGTEVSKETLEAKAIIESLLDEADNCILRFLHNNRRKTLHMQKVMKHLAEHEYYSKLYARLDSVGKFILFNSVRHLFDKYYERMFVFELDLDMTTLMPILVKRKDKATKEDE